MEIYKANINKDMIDQFRETAHFKEIPNCQQFKFNRYKPIKCSSLAKRILPSDFFHPLKTMKKFESEKQLQDITFYGNLKQNNVKRSWSLNKIKNNTYDSIESLSNPCLCKKKSLSVKLIELNQINKVNQKLNMRNNAKLLFVSNKNLKNKNLEPLSIRTQKISQEYFSKLDKRAFFKIFKISRQSASPYKIVGNQFIKAKGNENLKLNPQIKPSYNKQIMMTKNIIPSNTIDKI